MNMIPESHRDILENAQVVVLSTVGLHDEPQLTALWFLFEDGTLQMSLNDHRQKHKNLKRDPVCSAFFMDPATPYRTIDLRGTVNIDPDPNYVLADRVVAKFGANLRHMDQPGDTRSAVTLNIEKVHTCGQ